MRRGSSVNTGDMATATAAGPLAIACTVRSSRPPAAMSASMGPGPRVPSGSICSSSQSVQEIVSATGSLGSCVRNTIGVRSVATGWSEDSRSTRIGYRAVVVSASRFCRIRKVRAAPGAMVPGWGKGKETKAVRGPVERMAFAYSPREIVGVSTVRVIDRSASAVSPVFPARRRSSRGRPGPFQADCWSSVSVACGPVSAEAGDTPDRTSTAGRSRRRRRI